jgi:hypothetical protein
LDARGWEPGPMTESIRCPNSKVTGSRLPGPPGSGYSRVIGQADTATIREHAEAYDGPLPKRLDHDGVNDGFMEKGSQVLYYEDGAWQVLAGSD